MLKEAELNIFVIGDVDVLEIEKVFEKNIKRTTNSNEKDFTVKHSRIRKRVKKFIETSNFNQSKLEFGLKMDNLTDFERQYVMYVYSNILGGGAESLLFNEVRTKKSLCYYIYSSGNGQKNLLQIRAGIDGKNTDKVINLVKKCLDRMKNGDFSDEDIMNAKKCYINTLTENEDYISATLASYSGNYYFDRDDNDIKKERINEVTKEDIINVSKKIHLDTIYVLKGESNEN
jgi:predicted Zn-dependent peptidase